MNTLDRRHQRARAKAVLQLYLAHAYQLITVKQAMGAVIKSAFIMDLVNRHALAIQGILCQEPLA